MSVKPIYKVETYIVPEVNRYPIEITTNEIDDIKIKNQLNEKHNEMCKDNIQNEKEIEILDNCIEIAKHLIEDNKLMDIKHVKKVTNDKAILNKFDTDDDKYNNEHFYCDDYIKTQKMEFETSVRTQNIYPVKQFKRFNSLVSIAERSEDSEINYDFCHHGYEDGCTATISSPKEISEEIFKENWLQKIEILRQREVILGEKERHLLNREREVFEKEKELRIMKLDLKEKLRQVEQQLKYIEIMRKRSKRRVQNIECKSMDEFSNKDSNEHSKTGKNSQISINPYEKDKESNKKINLTHSKYYTSSRQPSSSNINTNVNSYSSLPYKEQFKSHNDLNSTLSADIGDSSFVCTSKWFDPKVYKKPQAFTRSISERRPKQNSQIMLDIEEKPKCAIEEDKLLRKLSENICISQDKDTRFQNYGIVDYCMQEELGNKMKPIPNSEGNLPQHNLEISNKLSYAIQKPVSALRDGPNSWNEETSEWLQKKRQAYNLAIEQSINNKENLKCNEVKSKDNKKEARMKKIFTLFH